MSSLFIFYSAPMDDSFLFLKTKKLNGPKPLLRSMVYCIVLKCYTNYFCYRLGWFIPARTARISNQVWDHWKTFTIRQSINQYIKIKSSEISRSMSTTFPHRLSVCGGMLNSVGDLQVVGIF